MTKKFIIFLYCVLSINIVLAQNINKLKNKRKKNQKELAYTNKILGSVKKKRESSLEKLYLLRKNIKKRSEIVAIYDKEIKSYKKREQSATNNINILDEKQEQIKEIYAQLLYKAYFEGITDSKWLYVFSSKNFSQAYDRYKYYEQFTEHISEQLAHLKDIQDSISDKRKELSTLLSKKEKLKNEKRKEQQKLLVQKKRQQSEVSKLKAREKDLLARLRVQKRRDKRLAIQIQKVINQNIKKAQSKKMTKKEILLGNSFASNKRKLPWPAKGLIFSEFGEHSHPILKKIKIRNNGIDIATDKGAACKSIFKGEVSKILSISGLNNTVILKHGTYMSIYANLAKVTVKAGDMIKTGQILGYVASSPNSGATILKLQIWKGKSCQNPTLWLQKR